MLEIWRRNKQSHNTCAGTTQYFFHQQRYWSPVMVAQIVVNVCTSSRPTISDLFIGL